MTEVTKRNITPNPFSRELSGYGKTVEGDFVSAYQPGTVMRRFHDTAQAYFSDLVGEEAFPCLAGRAVARTKSYAFAAYPSMTDPDIAEGVMGDMLQFQEDFDIPGNGKGRGNRFRSFVAAFSGPDIVDANHGARSLYTLLGNMHTVNAQHYPWKEGFSNDPDSPDFGYSSGDSAFFIASFHPKTHDEARRSDIPFVVFNSHAMLEALKSEGKFERLREAIRSRQSSVHPYLGDHGDVLEWRQYALLSPDPQTEAEEVVFRSDTLGACPFKPAL